MEEAKGGGTPGSVGLCGPWGPSGRRTEEDSTLLDVAMTSGPSLGAVPSLLCDGWRWGDARAMPGPPRLCPLPAQ